MFRVTNLFLVIIFLISLFLYNGFKDKVAKSSSNSSVNQRRLTENTDSRLLFSLFSCTKNPTESENKENVFQTPIALTAVINNFRQIFLVEYDNHWKYKRITKDSIYYDYAIFSHDRKKMIYSDQTHGLTHDPWFILYDLEKDKHFPLYSYSNNDAFKLTGNKPIIWSPDDSEIFIRFRSYWIDDPMIFDFNTQNKRALLMIHNRGYNTDGYVVGVKGTDTLIVFTNDTAATKQPWGLGLYYADMNFNSLSYLNNSHLELINRDGINLKAAYHIKWNNKLGLFTYAQSDSTIKGYKIAVTNLDGSYYRSYTSGEYYIDDHPTWGPEGKTILFDRRAVIDHNAESSKIMTVNVESGQVKVFLAPGAFYRTTSLYHPNY